MTKAPKGAPAPDGDVTVGPSIVRGTPQGRASSGAAGTAPPSEGEGGGGHDSVAPVSGVSAPAAEPAKGRAASKKEREAAAKKGKDEEKGPVFERDASGKLIASKDELDADSYVVDLPVFEGPLDLLLHLIQKHELDVLDIPIGFITKKYLEYLTMMQHLSIDVASEYLVMAATLALIKSKMLLPEVPKDGADDGSEEEELDPRAELVRRLLEYQKYKAAAEDLQQRDTLGNSVFLRGSTEPLPQGPAPFAALGVFDLLEAFNKLLSKSKVKIEHEIVFDRISISDRIVELTDHLKPRRSMPFEELFERRDERPLTRFDLVITFLAVLEMARLKLLRVFQTDPLSPIHVELAMVSEDDDHDPLGMHTTSPPPPPPAPPAEDAAPVAEAEAEAEAEPAEDAAPVAEAEPEAEPAEDAAPVADAEAEAEAEPAEPEAEPAEVAAAPVAEAEAEAEAEPAEPEAEPAEDAAPVAEAEAEAEAEPAEDAAPVAEAPVAEAEPSAPADDDFEAQFAALLAEEAAEEEAKRAREAEAASASPSEAATHDPVAGPGDHETT